MGFCLLSKCLRRLQEKWPFLDPVNDSLNQETCCCVCLSWSRSNRVREASTEAEGVPGERRLWLAIMCIERYLVGKVRRSFGRDLAIIRPNEGHYYFLILLC